MAIEKSLGGCRPRIGRALGLSVWLLFGSTASRADVILNELLALGRYAHLDDDGEAEDWVELYNSGPETVDLEGYSLTDDVGRPARWTFPSVRIGPGEFLVVWLSGKDRFRAPPESVVADPTSYAFDPVFVPPEAEWDYLVGDPAAGAPPPGWYVGDHVEAPVAAGRAGFGYGDGDDYTVVPGGTPSVFLRRGFEVDDPSRVLNLILQIDYDDGFAAYLNGTRVAAANAPAEPITYGTFSTAGHEAGSVERFDLSGRLDLLTAGPNVLAVTGLNVSATSSDMTLHPQLGVIPLVLHASFSLDADGELLLLCGPEGEPLDLIAFGEQTEDHSFGRVEPGSMEWRYLLTPTPGAPNETASFDGPISDEVRFSPPPGRFGDSILVSIETTLPDLTDIHFTTDGSEPGPDSPRYALPIAVAESAVIRAAGFIAGERSTRISSASYLLRSSSELPILSISMDPGDYEEVHNNAGGRGRAWERPAFMEYFDEDGVRAVATGMGMRLHGGAGRGGDFETKKAYKVYFRGVYGDTKLRYPIIPDTPVESFDKLVLRSAFNDSLRTNGRATYLRDQLIRDLHEEMGALVSHGSWCLLYVNMKPRGLFNIVERMDEEFLGSYTETEDWDVIKTGNDVLVGTADEWNTVRDWMVTHDLSLPVNYRSACQRIDVENFTGYMILNLWAQNHDWPHNNWYAARERSADGRWIFLSWDAEFGIGLIPSGHSADSLEFALGRNGYIREIFESLLGNAEYRRYFAHEVDRHVWSVLSGDNVLAHIDRLVDRVTPDIREEFAAFGRSEGDFLRNVDEMREFARWRGPVFQRLVEESALFDFPRVTTPIVDSVEPARFVNTGDVVLSIRGPRIALGTEYYLDGIPLGAGVPRLGQGFTVAVPLDPRLRGPASLRAVDPETGDEATYEDVIEVDQPVPRLDSVLPDEGAPSGGEDVRITGAWFLEGVRVWFGDVEALDVRRDDGGEEITVRVPPGTGEVEIRVANTRPTDLVAETSLAFSYTGLPFTRGDANVDGTLDLSDAIAVLSHLFLGGADLPCRAAADSDASRSLDLTDAVAVLFYLFQGGADLPAPFPFCGPDPDPFGLGCERGPGC